jgi:hypothetical protein
LHFAAAFVDGDAPSDDDLHAVFGAEAKQSCLRFEHDYAELRLSVFQRHVDVTGISWPVIGDFALDPDIRELAFKGGTNVGDKFADVPDLALGSGDLKIEGELIFHGQLRL